MNKKFISFTFISLVILSLLTPFMIFKDLLFPFVTSKAFYLRIMVEAALPFYVLLLCGCSDYRPSLKNPVSISVLAFFLLNLLSAFFGVNVLRSIWGNYERMGGVFYLGHLVLLYFYVLMIGQISANYLRQFLQFLVGVGAAVSLDGIMVQLTHNHFLLSDPSYPRVSGTFGNPIFIASFLVLTTFLTVFFAVSETVKWKQVYYWVIFLLQAWVIFLSQTRGSVVGLGIGIFIAAVLYVFLNPIRKLRIWGGYAILVFSIVVISLFALHSHLPQGSLLHRVFNLQDSNTTARIIQWGVALKGYKDHPILGVGPENYYIISNKYYNPAIFQYDPSWFDKPHNYLIEVLVTSGIVGFLAYVAMLAFSFWAMWAAYRKGILILSEFCILVCGLIVYQIQNLFVFDTVAASVAFFSYIGFMAYLYFEAYRIELPNSKRTKNMLGLQPAISYSVFGISVLAVIYIIYVGNVNAMQIGSDINYAYAYSSVDAQVAKSFFEKARSTPFDFDPIQFASKYADFASALAVNPQKQTAEFITQNLDDAIAVQKDALAQVPTDPSGWQELANLYLSQAIFKKSALDPEAINSAQKVIALAPLRPEGTLLLARLQLFQNDFTGAEANIQKVINNIPTDNEAKLELAITYAYNGQADKGLAIAQAVLDSGYVPLQARNISWMGGDYEKENNYVAAAKVYELMVKIDPSNLQTLWFLAQADAKAGKKQEAIQIAQSLIKSDPADAQNFQNFINSLQ